MEPNKRVQKMLPHRQVVPSHLLRLHLVQLLQLKIATHLLKLPSLLLHQQHKPQPQEVQRKYARQLHQWLSQLLHQQLHQDLQLKFARQLLKQLLQ